MIGTGAVMNKLHSVKPVLGNWQSSYRRCRKDEVVVCRQRGYICINIVLDETGRKLVQLCSARLKRDQKIIIIIRYTCVCVCVCVCVCDAYIHACMYNI